MDIKTVEVQINMILNIKSKRNESNLTMNRQRLVLI